MFSYYSGLSIEHDMARQILSELGLESGIPATCVPGPKLDKGHPGVEDPFRCSGRESSLIAAVLDKEPMNIDVGSELREAIEMKEPFEKGQAQGSATEICQKPSQEPQGETEKNGFQWSRNGNYNGNL